MLLGTGAVMYWTGLVRLSWRSGATFVHDWFALGLGLLVIGHIAYALRDPEARRGMRTGRVSAAGRARSTGPGSTSCPRATTYDPIRPRCENPVRRLGPGRRVGVVSASIDIL